MALIIDIELNARGDRLLFSYFALVDQTADVVGGVIPDCPGCYAAGDTFEEAIGNAAEALDQIAIGVNHSIA